MAIAGKTWDRLNMVFWGCVAVVVYLYCSGFCFSELRYLGDKDFITQAIQHNAYKIGVRDTPEAIEAFLGANPNCCAVYRNGMLSGFRSVEVELNFMDRSKSSVGNPPYYRQYVEITSCGGRGEQAGEHTETLKRAGEV